MRVLAIYDWSEDFDISKHPKALVAWTEDAGANPNKAALFTSERGALRNRTLFKRSRLIEILSEFEIYKGIALDDIRNTHYLDPNSHISFIRHDANKRYVVARRESEFSLNDEIRHLRLVCQAITPRYGFSNVGPNSIPIFATSGIVTTSMQHDDWTRTSDLGRMLRDTRQHLSGKLHDVYELNVLSPLHLEQPLQGRSLQAWIETGSRGSLLRILDQVFVWTVPVGIRASIRSFLFREGLLTATV